MHYSQYAHTLVVCFTQHCAHNKYTLCTLLATLSYIMYTQLTLCSNCLHTTLALLYHCHTVMLGWVTSEEVDMVQAAMAAIAALLITGAIEARKAVSYVDWGLLLLIGSAIGLSQAMSNSGLARYIGKLRI
jgi:di/tricarboxylate transporter